VLAVDIAVHQLKAHVLRPVLMGRAAHVHPLAGALSIAAGVIIAGISGALLAVPITACANAVVKSLAGKAGTAAENKEKVEHALEHEGAHRAKYPPARPPPSLHSGTSAWMATPDAATVEPGKPRDTKTAGW
jgi:hypothetical protein